jgi:hypothetical protein
VLVKDVKLVEQMVMVVNLLKIVEMEQVVQVDSIRMALQLVVMVINADMVFFQELP